MKTTITKMEVDIGELLIAAELLLDHLGYHHDQKMPCFALLDLEHDLRVAIDAVRQGGAK